MYIIFIINSEKQLTCNNCFNKIYKYKCYCDIYIIGKKQIATTQSEYRTYLFKMSKHESHTLTSFSIPNLGIMDDLEEHFPQKTSPQFLQWC